MFGFGKKKVDKGAWVEVVYRKKLKHPNRESKEQLSVLTTGLLMQHHRIILDCARLVCTTKNTNTEGCETAMTWEEFYEKFYEWADSTQVSRISQLTTFGSHEQVAEIIQMYCDEKAASRLAKKAMAAGVRFTPAEIVEMQGSVNKDCMNQLVTTALGDFTQEQVEELVFSMDDNIYADLEKRYCHYDDEDNEPIDEPIEVEAKQKMSGKLFGLFAFLGMASELGSQKKEPRFRVGEHVRVRWRGQEGTIIDINGGLYTVSIDDGRGVDSFPESDLEKAW